MKLREVRSWCGRAHGEQKYGDFPNQFPYSYHLDRVEAVAVRFGFLSRVIRIACQGHDLGEDAGATREMLLAAGFPARSVDIIMCVTDEPGATRKERKLATYPKIKSDRLAILVKLCDRIANVEFSLTQPRGGKSRMYKKEHAEFEHQLRDRNDSQLEPLWKHLEGLFAGV